MSVSTKVKMSHFVEQVKMAVNHKGQNDDAINTAFEFFCVQHDDDFDETYHLGFLVTELMSAVADFKDHQVEELDSQVSKLEQILETINYYANSHI